MARLGDVCMFQSGGTPSRKNSEYFNGNIPWVTTTALNGGTISLENANEWITLKAIEESAAKLVPAHSILVGTRVGVGKVAINLVPMSTSQDIISLTGIDQNQWNLEFLCKFISSKSAYLNSQARGATIKGIKIETLAELELPSYSIPEQHLISSAFNSLEKSISLRKQQLAKLDELVKSRFIEMFGDYDLSRAQTDWKAISEIGKVVSGATPKTNAEEYWDGEYRWITPAELSADSGYIYDSIRKLTKAGVDSCSLQEMPIDTVILSSRAPIGKVAIAGNTFYCNQGFKNIICNHEILPRYLYTVLLLNTEYLNSLGRGATFKEISKSIVESIRIPVPSVELQKQFAAFVEQIDKSKFEIQKSIEKLETLKKALMQKYFG